MAPIMPNRHVDVDIGVSPASIPCDLRSRKYDLFNFEEGSRHHVDNGKIQNLLQLSTYVEKNDNNLEHLKLNMLPENMFKEIQSSMSDWEEYMYCKEHEVLTKSRSKTDGIPDVRSCGAIIRYPERTEFNNNSFTCSKIEIRSHDDTWTDNISEEQKSKKELRAHAEKGRGNLAYKAGDFTRACEHYSNCIALIPLKEAYNNRAQANIKMQNYKSALLDLNEVLKQDPINTKALTRRAVCRSSIRMYHEALCDLQTLLANNSKNKEALSLIDDFKREISKLKGRKYRMRLISNLKKTFEVDVSQLPVYAEYEGDYVLEVDKSGCAKSCVCNYCIAEDQRTRFRSNGLRIKERPRWQRLTSALLSDLHVDVNITNTSATTTTTTATTSYHRSKETKNENPKFVGHTTGSSQKVSVDKFYEKQVRTKNLTNAAYNSYAANERSTSAFVGNAIPLPAADQTASQTKSMKDAKNMNYQRAEGVENALQNLRLEVPCSLNGNVADSLNNVPPASLKEKFDSRLDEPTLKNLIRFVCETFQPEKDWPLMSQYLKVIASLERFRIINSFIDSKAKNELLSMFSKAINMNLESAAQIKALYFPSELPD